MAVSRRAMKSGPSPARCANSSWLISKFARRAFISAAKDLRRAGLLTPGIDRLSRPRAESALTYMIVNNTLAIIFINREELMRRNFIGCAVAAAMLAGCSSSPSDGDIKQAVESMLGGCPYFSLEKFKKVNGAAAGQSRHLVDVAFTVKIAAVPGAKEIVEKGKNDSIAIDERLTATMTAKAKADSTERDYEARIDQAKQAKDEALGESLLVELIKFGDQKKQLEREIDVLEQQKRALYSSTVKPITDKINQCTKVHPTIGVYENNNTDQFTTPFTKDFAGTLTFVKTDNGWRAAL